MVKRVGILTGGGDCPGLNAVIAALVKSGIKEGYEFLGFRRGFEGLLGEGDYIELNSEAVRGIAYLGGTILGTTNRGHFAGKVDKGLVNQIDEELTSEVKDNLRKLNLSCLVVIGGDGSLSTALQFQKLGVDVIGIPKTIDNDLDSTDRTFGFSTSVEIITECMERIHTTAMSHDRVFLVETMGRNVGWLALYGGLAGGADMILIPEFKYRYENIVDFLRQRCVSGRNYSVIAVAEGAAALDEDQVSHKSAGLGENKLGGISYHIESEIERLAPGEFEIRIDVLGHLQRGGPPNAEDRILASRFGYGAFEAIHQENYGVMVALNGSKIETVSLDDAVSRVKSVTEKDEVVRTAKALGISFGL